MPRTKPADNPENAGSTSQSRSSITGIDIIAQIMAMAAAKVSHSVIATYCADVLTANWTTRKGAHLTPVQIGSIIGRNAQTVEKAQSMLQSLKLITRNEHSDGRGRRTPSTYDLDAPPHYSLSTLQSAIRAFTDRVSNRMSEVRSPITLGIEGDHGKRKTPGPPITPPPANEFPATPPQLRVDYDAARTGSWVDFAALDAQFVGRLEMLVPELLPGGEKQGRYWIALNPQRPENTRLGNLRINLVSGAWLDHGHLDHRGTDFVSLYAHCKGIGQHQAALVLGAQKPIAPVVPKPGLRLTKPDKKRTPFSDANLLSKGWRLVAVYPYIDLLGNTIWEECRYELAAPGRGKTRKVLLPRLRDGDGKLWMERSSTMVPFGLPTLIAHSGPILIVEGEKTAVAGHRFGIASLSVCSAQKGSAACVAQYLERLDREVYIVPDNDDPGREKARAMQEALRGRVPCRIADIGKVIALDDGGDIADLDGEWSRETVLELVGQAARILA